jgi:hypothetical protein
MPERLELDRKSLADFARTSPRFRVRYEARRKAGGAVVHVEGLNGRTSEWEPVRVPAELLAELADTGIEVVAGQVTSNLEAPLAPTSLDTTAQFVGLLLEPETLPGRLLAKVMGIFARAVALHFGFPGFAAGLIGRAVEHLFSPVPKPTGARGRAAKDVEGFTVICDLLGGHVTPTVVDFVAGHLG